MSYGGDVETTWYLGINCNMPVYSITYTEEPFKRPGASLKCNILPVHMSCRNVNKHILYVGYKLFS